MITRNGFVLCEITGEYDDVCVTPIAYSDNQFELEQEIARLNEIVEKKQKTYDYLLIEAQNLVSDLNSKLESALVDYDKDLKFEEELPKPEKWPPQTGKEMKEWGEIKNLNYEISRRNTKLREDKKLEIVNEFKKNNEIPTHLKEIVQFSCQWSVLQKFLIRTRPDLANYEIRSL